MMYKYIINACNAVNSHTPKLIRIPGWNDMAHMYKVT